MSYSRTLIHGLVFGAMALAGVQASEASMAEPTTPWTTAGSCGTVDEADLGIVALNTSEVALVAGAAVGSTVDIRYNVVGVEGVDGSTYTDYCLRARYVDNGGGAQVLIKLYSYDIFTGVTTLMMTLDSNAFGAAAGFQTNEVIACFPPWSFDFDTKVYYLDVQLKKSATNGTPKLRAIQIQPTLC